MSLTKMLDISVPMPGLDTLWHHAAQAKPPKVAQLSHSRSGVVWAFKHAVKKEI
jgi:hypothetical protein